MNMPVAGTPAAAPAAAPASAPAAAPAEPPQWFSGFQDPQLREWVQAAGVKDPESAAAKALSLERMLGADRAGRTVVIPSDDDPKAWADVHAKLGRPAAPTDYKIPVPDGGDPQFAAAAAGAFHAAGLTAKQAESVSAWWNEHVGKQMAEANAQEAAALKKEHDALQADWGNGPAYEQQKELARRAAVSLGLDAASIDALEKVAGFSKVMKAFAKVGKSMGESEAVGMGERQSFAITPEAAKGEKARLMADAEWRAKAQVPNSAQWAQLTRLNEVIAAGMQQG